MLGGLSGGGPLLERLERGPGVDRLTDEVWWFRLGWYPPLRQNVYLVDDGEVTLVDLGLPWDTARLRRFLEVAGYGIADLDRVLVTHYDLDHLGGALGLVGDLEAPIYIGAPDLALASGEDSPSLLHHKGAFHRLLRRLYPLPAALDVRPVEEGDDVGGFVAYHTPGHNPGHTVYVHEGLGAAFLGDLVWEDDGRLTTPLWLDSYDMAELADSVVALAERIPHFELACMGHGQPLQSGGHEALTDLADRLRD
jgi:glyoxylase-like metal-dependent hydrolase (beta-lactamase superfamily II)